MGFRWGLIGVAIGTTAMECLVKLVKVIYAGSLVSMSLHETLLILIRSCKFAIILIPACVLVYLFTPQGLACEIVLLIVFSLLSVILFLFFPGFIGKDYKDDLFPTIKGYALRLIKRNK